MGIVIKGGRVLNPPTHTDAVFDLRIDEERISGWGIDLPVTAEDIVIDASGKLVMPGFIDLHVHFRDPGQTHKEDVITGSKAAVAGGFTTVCAMPNTTPTADNGEIIRYVHDKAKEAGLCKVYQVGAITKGMAGKELSDIDGMLAEGCVALSEDGKSVMDSSLLRAAMIKCKEAGIPVLSHCEDINLVEGGVMNAGDKAAKLGVKGITNAVENVIEARDIMLAEETGAKLHLCHCSTKESYDILRDAKAKGIPVTGEVCPHHFTLTEADIPTAEDANYKMNPPLRSKADKEALRKGLSEGVFEVISTDHAPHTPEEKAKGFNGAPFGIVGLETSAVLVYTELVESGLLSGLEMARRMSTAPASVLGIDRGNIAVGKAADLVIFDPQFEGEIRAEDFRGKAKNMPYEGRRVRGSVDMTIYEGRIVFDRAK